jgi:mannitol-specific phosphotransferase system IIBC component
LSPGKKNWTSIIAFWQIALGKVPSEVYNFAGPEQSHQHAPGIRVCGNTQKGDSKMKKVLAMMFALALSISMSSFAFAQDKMDKPADKKEEKAKPKKEKKEKKAKKEKKDEMKKDEAK